MLLNHQPPLTLAAARAAARQGKWHSILRLPLNATTEQIRQARRRLQLSAHTDKGGCAEMSQLINQATDELLSRRPEIWAKQQWTRAQEAAEERRKQAEEEEAAAAQRRLDAKRREEERQQRCEEHIRKTRAENHRIAMKSAAMRGARRRSKVYLSVNTGIAFRTLRRKVERLQCQRGYERARLLAYAAEAEVATRRGIRETRFPKTAGLARREPVKAAALAGLKAQYDRA